MELKPYIATKEIARSLGSRQGDALVKAMELSGAIDQAILLTKMSAIPSSVLFALLEEQHLTYIDSQSQLESTKLPKSPSWLQVSKLYLKQSQVTPLELANRTYFFLTLMPSLFQVILKTDNPELTKLTYETQLNIRTLLLKLPKKNIHKYRSMNLGTLVSSVYQGTLSVSQEETLALDTINKSLKRLKSLLLFSQNSGMYTGVIPSMTIENKIQSRGQRKEFTQDELKIIDESLESDPIYPIVKILRYTGMRFSELLKCSMTEIEGVLCFDLRTPSEALKTLSSHRVIPVHNSIKDSLEGFQELIRGYSDKHFTKKFTKVIHRHLEDSKSKSLYSLRHTFATNLIAKGIPPEIVSELLGHSHATMTLNRYVKGYPVLTLQSAINSL